MPADDFDPTAPDLDGMVAVAFLDEYGRFAKRLEVAHVVRIFWDPTLSGDPYSDIPWEDFEDLPEEMQETLRNGPSGAGYVETSGISNA